MVLDNQRHSQVVSGKVGQETTKSKMPGVDQ